MVATSFAISIVLTGLIAIVPNEGHEASFATAYLVKDAAHSPSLRVYGTVTFNSEKGGPNCAYFDSCERGRGVVCDLTDTVVSLGGADAEGVPRPLPVKAGRELPDPKVQSDGQSKNWVVRMSNIETGIGRVKTPGDLVPYITSQIQFGWDTMESAELDGSEEGANKIARIGFKPASGPPSTLKQAVAEEIHLRTTITKDPVFISVVGRNNKRSVITAKCKQSNCFAIEVDNSASDASQCDAAAEGQHFAHYYDLVRSPGKGMLPFSLDPRGCPVSSAQIIDIQLLDVGLNVLRPVIPAVSKKIRADFPNLEGKQRVFLIKAIEKLPVDTRKQRACAERLIFHQMQVQNRVICPPVVLEP